MVWMAVTVPSWPSFVLRAAFKETEQSAVGTLAEFGEKLAIVAEVDTQYFRQSKDVLAVRDGRKDRAAQQDAELDLHFCMAAWAEPAPLATKQQQVLVAAIGAAHPGKVFAQIPTLQVIAYHVIDNHTSISIRTAKCLLVASGKCQIVLIEQFPQYLLLRLP